MRRSEVSALCWADVVDATVGDGFRSLAEDIDTPGAASTFRSAAGEPRR